MSAFSGNGRLGSGVMPVSDDKPPINERGSMTNMAFGIMPGWDTLIEAFDELETNPKLAFPESVNTYHAMKTDPQVQGLLMGATWPLMRMLWYLKPNGAKPEAVKKISTDLNLPVADSAEELQSSDLNKFEQRRTQHRFNFLEHLETALDAIAYGFMIFEQVGYIGKDGMFHYRKLALRPPQSITEIKLAQDGNIEFVRQGNLLDRPLDINRIVVYSFQRRGANWHGRSMLRGCYAPWLLKDRAMRVGVMNIQRAGVGTPVATGHPGASESDLRVLSEMTQKFVAGDRSGGAIPYGAMLRLIGVEGSQPDTVGFVKLCNEEMSRAFFEMFMQLGQTTSGSRALGQSFIEYHKLTIEYIAQWYSGIFNEHVIEDDIEWNYGPDEEFAPLLCWAWDTEGVASEDGAAAARNPAQKLQELSKDGTLHVDKTTQEKVTS